MYYYVVINHIINIFKYAFLNTAVFLNYLMFIVHIIGSNYQVYLLPPGNVKYLFRGKPGRQNHEDLYCL